VCSFEDASVRYEQEFDEDDSADDGEYCEGLKGLFHCGFCGLTGFETPHNPDTLSCAEENGNTLFPIS